MSTREQKELFIHQMNLAKEQGIKEKASKSSIQPTQYTIKDKITPQIRKKFLLAVRQTKETGKEHGFHMCTEKDGKLFSTNMCTGDECSIKLYQTHMPCAEKKVQGSFHTHPYFEDVKKYFNITSNMSDQLKKEAIRQFLEEKLLTVTMPSHADARDAILGKCSKKTEGTICIGTDLDDSRVECWTPKDIDDGDCMKALTDRLGLSLGNDKESTLPHEWIRPLFNVEMINLKSIRKIKSDKR